MKASENLLDSESLRQLTLDTLKSVITSFFSRSDKLHESNSDFACHLLKRTSWFSIVLPLISLRLNYR